MIKVHWMDYTGGAEPLEEFLKNRNVSLNTVNQYLHVHKELKEKYIFLMPEYDGSTKNIRWIVKDSPLYKDMDKLYPIKTDINIDYKSEIEELKKQLNLMNVINLNISNELKRMGKEHSEMLIEMKNNTLLLNDKENEKQALKDKIKALEEEIEELKKPKKKSFFDIFK